MKLGNKSANIRLMLGNTRLRKKKENINTILQLDRMKLTLINLNSRLINVYNIKHQHRDTAYTTTYTHFHPCFQIILDDITSVLMTCHLFQALLLYVLICTELIPSKESRCRQRSVSVEPSISHPEPVSMGITLPARATEDGQLPLYLDYRRANSVTTPDIDTLPLVNEQINGVKQSQFVCLPAGHNYSLSRLK